MRNLLFVFAFIGALPFTAACLGSSGGGSGGSSAQGGAPPVTVKTTDAGTTHADAGPVDTSGGDTSKAGGW